jgi:iron complex transport system substrate-binding protein
MRLRTLLAAPLALALLSLAACGSSASDDPAAGPWKFTDGRGTKISLDTAPKRLVAQTSIAAALKDLGVKVDGVFGPLKLNGAVDPQAAGLNPAKVTDVTGGGEYGALNLEKLASLKPDLLVTNMYTPPELWYVNPATEKKVDKLVPTLAINFEGKSLTQSITAVEKVAVALGANVKSAKQVKAKADFNAAAARLRTIGTELGNRKVLVVSGATDLLYVADPQQFPDVAFYESLGLPIVKAKAKAGSYWEDLSWEKSDKYDADIVMWDSREGDSTLKLLKGQPVFSTIKAARDNAWVPWQAVAPPSYQAYAKVMNALADQLEKQV